MYKVLKTTGSGNGIVREVDMKRGDLTQEFAPSAFQNQRLHRRTVKTVLALAANPGNSLAAAMENKAALQGAW